jgi:Flp pilus assembly protein TadB
MSVALEKPFSSDAAAPSVDEPESASDSPLEHDDGLLAVAGPIMVLCYVLFFAVASATFFGSGAALFAVVISMVFAAVFFAIPILFLRMRAARDQRWRRGEQATSPVVDVCTGSMRRWEAIVQIISIPLTILMGFSLLAIRWALL